MTGVTSRWLVYHRQHPLPVVIRGIQKQTPLLINQRMGIWDIYAWMSHQVITSQHLKGVSLQTLCIGHWTGCAQHKIFLCDERTLVNTHFYGCVWNWLKWLRIIQKMMNQSILAVASSQANLISQNSLKKWKRTMFGCCYKPQNSPNILVVLTISSLDPNFSRQSLVSYQTCSVLQGDPPVPTRVVRLLYAAFSVRTSFFGRQNMRKPHIFYGWNLHVQLWESQFSNQPGSICFQPH